MLFSSKKSKNNRILQGGHLLVAATAVDAWQSEALREEDSDNQGVCGIL